MDLYYLGIVMQVVVSLQGKTNAHIGNILSTALFILFQFKCFCTICKPFTAERNFQNFNLCNYEFEHKLCLYFVQASVLYFSGDNTIS